jgi:hypothetical protein
MMDEDKCGVVGGMIDRGNRSIRKNLAPRPFRPPQIPHDMCPGRCCGKLATNRLSCGTAVQFLYA